MIFESLDIHTGVQTALALTLIGIALCLVAAWRRLRSARALKFFRMRRDRQVAGWRLIFAAAVLTLFAFFLYRFAEPVAYSFYPPTPTQTLTPTITRTPTISLTPTISPTPTITNTPSETDTPTISPTPRIPLAVEVEFSSTTTPNFDVVFSPLQIAQALQVAENAFVAVDPATLFQNPVGHLYALFSYVGMVEGSQWTALWYRGSELVHYETKPWDGASAGWGYTDWEAEPYEWQPGDYEIQIFVGTQWILSGYFTVEGDAPTPPPSATPSRTSTATFTPTPTRTATPTRTPTFTRTNTGTPTLSRTPSDTPTRTPTRTIRPTATKAPTNTKAPTATRWPTNTRKPRTPSITPTVTNTRAPTLTPSVPPPTNTRAPWPTTTPTR
ncbi:MAG: hypothetical protein ACOYYS_15600 [Chloroflexota bacterium]